MAKTRELTPMQAEFLEALFGEARGSISEAKRITGFYQSTSEKKIIDMLGDEMIGLARAQLSRSALKAAFALSDAMDDPVTLGVKEKMRAAEQVLDRVGIVKTEKIEVDTGGSAVILLPPKN